MEVYLHRITSEGDTDVVPSYRFTGPRMTCGRDGDLRVDSVKDPGSISRLHAILEIVASQLIVTDLSVNGVLLNARSIPRVVPTVAFHSDLITFGDNPTELTFRIEIRGGDAQCRDVTHRGMRASGRVLRVTPQGTTRIDTFEAISTEQNAGCIAAEDRLSTLTSYLCQREGGDPNPLGNSTTALRTDRAAAMLEYLTLTYDPAHDTFDHRLSPASYHNAIVQLCADTETAMAPRPMLVEMASPCYVLGDIHGNYRDLRRILAAAIPFRDMRYSPSRLLFLGDYVDRGPWGLEVVLHILALYALHGDAVVMLRGNHEDADINGDADQYGDDSFLVQLTSRFGNDLGRSVWAAVNRVFTHLPLACVVDKAIFACHGGVPRTCEGGGSRSHHLQDTSFPHFNHIMPVANENPHRARLREIARDLLWADPCEDEAELGPSGFAPSHRAHGNTAIAVEFGKEALLSFLAEMGCEILLRAHQHKSEGLRLAKGSKVITVFSTSAYCSGTNNAGVAFVHQGTVEFISFQMDAPPAVRKSVTPRRVTSPPLGGRVPKKLWGRPSK